MNTGVTTVFLSYSRKDYYFAESLARHLDTHGIKTWVDVSDLQPGMPWQPQIEAAIDRSDCMVLVASGKNVHAPNVQAEWRRALERKQRIVIALFRPAQLPNELQHCPIVSFRGIFDPALRSLLSALQADGPPAQPYRSWIPIFPPWVTAVAVALAIAALGFLLGVNYKPGPNDPEYLHTLVWTTLPFLVLLFLSFFFVSFLRRRMGMTRLALCLLFFGTGELIPLVQYYLHGLASLKTVTAEQAANLVGHPGMVAAFGLVPLAMICMLIIIRPEDILRWTPTGRAWEWFRSTFNTARPGFASPFTHIRQIRVINHPSDQPAAQHLAAHLGDAEPAGPLLVLLITNRTPVAWLAEQLSTLPDTAVPVVGTGVKTRRELEPLWFRQWLDLRDWKLDNMTRAGKLPQVPEALQVPRFPTPIRILHHLFCALISSLTFVMGASIADDDETLQSGLAALAAIGLATWLIFLARSLLKRGISSTAFFRTSFLVLPATAVLMIWDVYQAILINRIQWYGGAVAVGLPLLALAAVVGLRPRSTFWFPEKELKALRKIERIRSHRNWQTLLWISVYLLGWALLLDTS